MPSLAGELSPQVLSGAAKARSFSLWPGADQESAGRPPTVPLEAGAAPVTGVAGLILTQMESRPRLVPLGACPEVQRVSPTGPLPDLLSALQGAPSAQAGSAQSVGTLAF